MSEAARPNSRLDTALAEAESRYLARNPESRRQYEAAARAMPGGNTRSVLFYPPFPLTLAHGEGCRVVDLDGHAYLDVVGEYTAGLYGHSHPVIVRALKQALDDGIAMGGPIAAETVLAQAVCDRFRLQRVRFTNSGTEANLMAISTARAATKRSMVMVMSGGYHGGVLYFARPEVPINAPFPYLIGRYNDIAGCRDLIRRHADSLACVILEPMMGSAGCIPATPEFLGMLRHETEAAGALLILDEVMTSRLAPHGLQAVRGIAADLTTLGKYVGGGLSFGAFGGRADLLDLYDPRRPDALPHAGTFNNNRLTMTAGAAGLTGVYPPEAAIPFNAAGDRLRERLNATTRRLGVPVQFTGLGSMLCVHFRDAPVASFEDAQAGRNELRALLHLDLLEQGIYATRRGMFVLSLPMGPADHDALAGAVEEFLASRASLLSG